LWFKDSQGKKLVTFDFTYKLDVMTPAYKVSYTGGIKRSMAVRGRPRKKLEIQSEKITET
jgi:hypothetical protein